MAALFWIIAALAIANAVRLIRNKARNDDVQARLNYERHVADMRRTSYREPPQRAGHRRDNEFKWGRE